MYVVNWFGVEGDLALGALRDPDQTPPSTDNAQGGRFLSSLGQLLVTEDLIAVTDTYNGAFRISPEGAVRVLENPGPLPSGVQWNQGLPFNAQGQLLVCINVAPDHYVAGLPVNIFGVPCFSAGIFIPPAGFDLPLTDSLIPVRPGQSFFNLPLIHTLEATPMPDATPTFTRATTAYVTDFEGVMRQAAIGEARFTGARRVRNLNTAAMVSWATSVNVAITTGVIDPLGGTTAITVTATANSGFHLSDLIGYGITGGEVVCNSLWVRRRTGTGAIYLANGGSDQQTAITAQLTGTWQRFAPTLGSGIPGAYIGPIIPVSGDAIDIAFPQVENVTGQSNQAPSEYVSVGVLPAPYHGAGIDGVKYFRTLNGNSVAGNVVSEAVGAPIPPATLKKYLSEGARTNLCLQSANLTTASGGWSKNSAMLEPSPVTGPDGAMSAFTLTQSGVGSAQWFRNDSIAVVAQSYTASIWIRRRAGTGAVSLYNLGASPIAITPQVTSSWSQVSIAPVVAGSVDSYIGILLITDGDSVDVWIPQLENAPFASSPIPTTTAAVTRNADVLTYPSAGNMVAATGSAYCESQTSWTVGQPATVYAIANQSGVDGRAIFLGNSSPSTRRSLYDGASAVVEKTGLTDWTTGVRKTASAWGGVTQKITGDGATPASGTFDGTMDLGTTVNIGGNWYGNIGNVKIWPVALTDAQLQALTS